MYECKFCSVLNTIAYVLIVVGALNWGLIGLFDFNLVTWLFGEGTLLTKITYILIGAFALLSIVLTIINYFRERE